MKCIFVSDLHGERKKYTKLFRVTRKEKADALFFGGDLLPNSYGRNADVVKFMDDVFLKGIKGVRKENQSFRAFVIMGNDDPKSCEKLFKDADNRDIIDYVHHRRVDFNELHVVGYSYVPPTPFQLKDWERYDISRYVDVGSVSPEKGFRTIDIPENEVTYSTIENDLEQLALTSLPEETIYLFHSPPYGILDMVDWKGQIFDHVTPDIHVGSIGIRRFIEKHSPLITLHGHIHESARLTDIWKTKYHGTHCFNASHDGPELSVIKFDTDMPEKASRDIISVD